MSKAVKVFGDKGELKNICDEWIKSSLSKGDRGQLRRSASMDAMVANESVFRLERRLHSASANDELDQFADVAALAALLAGLRTDANNVLFPAERIAMRAGSGKEGNPVFSRARLGKLLAAHAVEKRLRAFRELLRILDNRADSGELAAYFLHWQRAKTRWRFAREYFAQLRASDADSELAPADSVS